MKVCLTLGGAKPSSGITKVVVNIANLLAEKKEYEVHLLCTCKIPNEIFHNLNNKILVDSIHRKYNKLSMYLGTLFHIRKYIRQNEIQVLVISGMEWVLFYYFGLLAHPVSMLAWEHRNFGAGPKFRLEWIGKRLACRYFKGIINITKKDQALYGSYSKKAKLYQIYNVCGMKETKVNYDSASKKIISVGYLAHIKGFDMLIDVASKVLPKYPDWSWDIYGKGEMERQLQDKIDSLHLSNQLRLAGYHENINELYSKYSFFVMTSRIEGFGMVLIEAQRNGLPIISFDIPCGPSDTIVDGKNGFLIEPFNTDTMAERIKYLIENEKIRKFFSDNSFYCHNEMKDDYILGKWIKMIDSVILGSSNES